MQCGLVGDRLGHSYSQKFHTLLGRYDYALYELSPERFPAFILAKNYRGLNITIPYKKEASALCDCLSPNVQRIGSVNTIVNNDGVLHGYNTDYDGFLSLAHHAGISFKNKSILLLGSGGTARTVQTALADSGAREITVVSRRGPIDYTNVYNHRSCDILVNTTPVGMYPNNEEAPLDLDRFPSLEGALDVIYNPHYSRLALAAKLRGIKYSGGLPMLLSQAALSAQLFLNEPLDSLQLRDAEKSLRADTTNIILIGMPGSGKSTLGALVAARLNKPFIDIDEIIAARAQKSIPEIFADDGEDSFRRFEREIIAEFGQQSGRVIAAGGGAILLAQNALNLMQNGRLYYILRPITLLDTCARPLSKDIGALKEMFAQRHPLYVRYSDCFIKNTATPEAAADKIVEDFYENLCD